MARRISVQREFREVNRIRNGFERTLAFRLISLFSQVGTDTAQAFEANGTQGADAVLARLRPRMAGTLEPVYRQIIKTFSERAIAHRGVKRNIAGWEEIYEQFLATTGARHISDIDDTTTKIIRRTIQSNQGAGVAAISKAIRERMSPPFTRSRAATIARTETHSAASYATHEQYKSFDEPDMMKQWVATNDERTRAAHFAVSGKEIPIDEDFIVGGKPMSYPSDPRGGAAEVINCRCVLVYIEPDDVVVDEPSPKPPPPPTGTPMAEGVIDVLKARTAKKLVTEKLRKASLDAKYPTRAEAEAAISRGGQEAVAARTWLRRGEAKFQGRNSKQYGEFKSTGLTDEAATATNIISDELEDLAVRCNVPPLRGYRVTTARTKNADMGDGVMGINVDTMNARAAGVGRNKGATAGQDRIDALQKDYDDLRAQFTAERDEYDRLYGGVTSRRDLTDDQLEDYQARYTRLRSMQNKIQKSQVALGRASRNNPDNIGVSQWKYGDDVADRPFSVAQYHEAGLDRMRSTYYHEMGHHVHQMFGVTKGPDWFLLYNKPLVERWMGRYLPKHFRKSASRYGDKNTAEWFAENFSLYFMNKRGLVDPEFTKLIEKIMDNDVQFFSGVR